MSTKIIGKVRDSKLGKSCNRRPMTLGIGTTGSKVFGGSGRPSFGSINLHRPQLNHGVCTQEQSSIHRETCQPISDTLLIATYLSLGVPLSLGGLCIPTWKMRL